MLAIPAAVLFLFQLAGIPLLVAESGVVLTLAFRALETNDIGHRHPFRQRVVAGAREQD